VEVAGDGGGIALSLSSGRKRSLEEDLNVK